MSDSLHNESINSRRSTFVSKPSRSTIRIVKDPNSTRLSLCNSTLFEDVKGIFLNTFMHILVHSLILLSLMKT
ncbi:unnamed protein product [Arctia plantaginis]|uniref:Uncharacterized protein n=1 Tax=Arctia plantaginis TaxID=874455 RepID=A0A8S1B7A1_ARCPL|nr:unnamed protein product [Arctia plantaginis]CAB3254453.1 unnamed protein product [Arctia plantaginis]